jgi:hypothetical protein
VTCVGRVAEVTGRVAAGTVGEVLVPVDGGLEAFNAFPAWDDETFEVGEAVLVIVQRQRDVWVGARR